MVPRDLRQLNKFLEQIGPTNRTNLVLEFCYNIELPGSSL